MKNFDHQSGEWLLTEDGAKLYYEVTGNQRGPVLLLLHGGFGSIEDFNLLLGDFDEDFKVIGIDSRGHGKSTLGLKPLSYEQIRQDVESVLEHLGIHTLSMIGFSDGGIVAYRLASSTDLSIEKLVTIGSHWRLRADDPARAIFSGITPAACKSGSPDSYAAYQALNPEPDFDRYVESIVTMWLASDATAYPNEAVRKISCPLLIVRGDEDHLLSLADVVALRGLVGQSALFNIPFAGHSAFAEQKELFMSGLLPFLRSKQN